ncbi:TPA: hypothetical protein ACOJP0_004972 [Vibrio harveyi]|uniref:hypothetical protein n=1 Tax=Vibrio harveyi TaxID=669 RepID=UPI003908EFAD
MDRRDYSKSVASYFRKLENTRKVTVFDHWNKDWTKWSGDTLSIYMEFPSSYSKQMELYCLQLDISSNEAITNSNISIFGVNEEVHHRYSSLELCIPMSKSPDEFSELTYKLFLSNYRSTAQPSSHSCAPELFGEVYEKLAYLIDVADNEEAESELTKQLKQIDEYVEYWQETL